MNSNPRTAIAQRVLKFGASGASGIVPVTIYLPRASGNDWCCAYEIGWPTGTRQGQAFGVDSVQALLLAMQTIGAELYATRPSGIDDLQWLEKGGGFGFPLSPAVRDMAVGEDRLM